MPIKVKLPNGQIGSFPDDMPHEEIEAVLQKQFGFNQNQAQSQQQPHEQSFLNKLPRNIGAGITEGIAGLANIPYDIARQQENVSQPQDNYEKKLLASLGEKQNQQPLFSSNEVPHFNEHNYSKMFGLTQEPTFSDKAIQFGSGLISPGALFKGAQVASKGIPLAAKLAKAFGELPLTANMASKPLKQARSLAKERNISNISVPKDILKEAQDFLPKNMPTRNLIKEAKKGNYDPFFTLQSDLGKTARQLSKSPSGAERLYGEQANDLRKRLIEAMHSSLSKSGHEDIGQLMSKGQNKYRQYKKLDREIYPKLRKAGIGVAAGVGIPTGYRSLKSMLSGDSYY